MARRSFLLLFAILAAASACRRGGQAAAPEPWTPLPTAVRLYYDNGGGIQDSVRMVIRSADEFAALWRQATSLQTSPPPVPHVDFDREMVLVIGAGRMTTEDHIEVDSIGLRRTMDPDGRQIQVLTATIRVSEGCRRFQIDAYPLEIVRIRRFDGPVQFVERRVPSTDCREEAAHAPAPRPILASVRTPSPSTRP